MGMHSVKIHLSMIGIRCLSWVSLYGKATDNEAESIDDEEESGGEFDDAAVAAQEGI